MARAPIRRGMAGRLGYRLRFYRFFFLAPLYAALPFFLGRLREPRLAWVVAALAIFAIGTNFYPYFFQHYIAAVACLMVLASVTALETLSRVKLRGWPAGREAALLLLFLCAAHFLFFYGVRLFGDEGTVRSVARYEGWDYINIGDAEGRRAVQRRLDQIPGQLLVFVRYGPSHMFQEWMHNDADIDAARIVWADDLGDTENETLLDYYPGRAAWSSNRTRSRPAHGASADSPQLQQNRSLTRASRSEPRPSGSGSERIANSLFRTCSSGRKGA